MLAGAGAGGLGLIAVVVVMLLSGGSGGGLDLDGLMQSLGTQAPASTPQSSGPEEAAEGEFVAAVLGTTETYWGDEFAAAGDTYPAPTLVLFTGATSSRCGGATAQVGPHYCPVDETIYVDLGFFTELQQRFGASGGDFAEAYVIAHEVGHHIQKVTGTMDQVRTAQSQNPGRRNELSVLMELQADCYAGVWANSVLERDVLQPGDIEEGLDAAAAVGDDRIQERATGRVDPESWTHGSAEQRVRWFTIGFESGDPEVCNTFTN
jgi:predicted metalloprotease